MKIKNGSRYVYQCSRYETTSNPKRWFYPLHVVAMCISQAVFGPFCSRYVYTFIIYHVFASTNDRREEAGAPKRRTFGQEAQS
jgi:hypothetical protein